GQLRFRADPLHQPGSFGQPDQGHLHHRRIDAGEAGAAARGNGRDRRGGGAGAPGGGRALADDVSSVAMSAASISIRPLTGSEILAAVAELAALRMQVFAEWPYLYAGDADYEAEYVKEFIAAPDALLVAACD